MIFDLLLSVSGATPQEGLVVAKAFAVAMLALVLGVVVIESRRKGP